MKPLSRSFYLRPTLTVAQDLLGKQLNFYGKTGIITETEAYIGIDDPACHASVGKTKRNAVMFGDGGYSYVYLIYGMYNCLNFVTEEEGKPAAVLIRGIKTEDTLYDGPGKLCRYMEITREHSGLDITQNPDFFLSDTGINLEYKATPRIGISKGKEKLWRFVIE